MADEWKRGVRVQPAENVSAVAQAAGFLYIVGGLAAVVISVAPEIEGQRGVLVTGGLAVIVGVVVLLIGLLKPEVVVGPWVPVLYSLNFSASVFITVGLFFAGPTYIGPGTALYTEAPIFGFWLLHRRIAPLTIATVGLEYAVLLAVKDVPGHHLALWAFLMLTLSGLGVAVGLLMGRSDRLAEGERHAREALAEVNDTLEARVTDQVAELDRLSRLRRFLPPQVADAVLEAGDDSVLTAHRRQIAVLFCDLRGFTHFAGASEPEEVVEVLDDFYRAVGGLIANHEATVGTFAGDGIMAYFNDPVPCPDPAGKALAMALAIRGSMSGLLDRWAAQGFDLGYGIGVAYGYATLGTIGYEGRYDYTAVGSVVNLAARLCAEAKSGEILVDERAHAGIPDALVARPRSVALKGYSEPVSIWSIRTQVEVAPGTPT